MYDFFFSVIGFTPSFFFFFFNDTATTEIYTLSLHDALPISHDISKIRTQRVAPARRLHSEKPAARRRDADRASADRKSTRLNSSHLVISYAVFCLKKKKKKTKDHVSHLRLHSMIDETHL